MSNAILNDFSNYKQVTFCCGGGEVGQWSFIIWQVDNGQYRVETTASQFRGYNQLSGVSFNLITVETV